MCEMEKGLKFVTLNVSRSRGGEMFIIQQDYWSGLQVCTTKGNIRNNDSKVKIMTNDLCNF